MTIGINGLTEMESEMIASSFERDITSGILGTGLYFTIVHGNITDEEKEHIVNLIYSGYTSGYYPKWQLTFERR